MRALVLASCVLTLAACAKEHTGTVAGPGLTAVPAVPSATESAAPSAPASSSSVATPPRPLPELVTAANAPVKAVFVDLGGAPYHVNVDLGTLVYVADVKGTATLRDQTLSDGDVAIVPTESKGPGDFDLGGSGTALVAIVTLPPETPAPSTLEVVRASSAPELTWANGTLHAHLDVEGKPAYIGRLSGTAPVAEHVHKDSWEILATIDAAGTFTLAGNDQRLGARQIVMVPPNTKHAWKPDPGSTLVAIQLYDPPGPEQRFKALAGGH